MQGNPPNKKRFGRQFDKKGSAAVKLEELVSDLRGVGPTLDVPIAAGAIGVSRQTLYTAIKEGRAPVQTIKVLGRIKVLTESVIDLLEGRGPRQDGAA